MGGMLHKGDSHLICLYQTITLAAYHTQFANVISLLTMNWQVTQEDAMRPVGRLLLTREGSCMDQEGGVENGKKYKVLRHICLY